MGGISNWVPEFLHRNSRLHRSQRQPGCRRHHGHRRHRRNPHRRLDRPALAAHQPPRPLPAFLLERRAHPALRNPALLRPRRLGRSRRSLPPSSSSSSTPARSTPPSSTRSPAPVRATAVSINLFCIHCFGDTFSPQIIGAISDRTRSLRLGLGATLISLVVSGIILRTGARFAPPLEEAGTRG